MKVFALVPILAILLSCISFAQQASCDYKVEILVDGGEFEKENFKWRMMATKIEGKATNITGTAEIEDSKAEIIKKYRPWSNESISKQKTSSEYTPNLKEGVYRITSRIDVGCDDTNKGNDVDFKIIKIREKNNKTADAANQSIQNTFIEDKPANTTKNNPANESLTDWKNESISQTAFNQTPKSNISYEKETEQSAEEDNVIHLMSNGDKKTEAELTAAAVQKSETVYESSNEKAKGMIVIFLLILSVLLNIILIWKR